MIISTTKEMRRKFIVLPQVKITLHIVLPRWLTLTCKFDSYLTSRAEFAICKKRNVCSQTIRATLHICIKIPLACLRMLNEFVFKCCMMFWEKLVCLNCKLMHVFVFSVQVFTAAVVIFPRLLPTANTILSFIITNSLK